MENISIKKLIIIFYLIVIIFTCIFAMRIENLECKEVDYKYRNNL